MTAPCKNCPYRAIGCHSYCGPYKQYKQGKAQEGQRRRYESAAYATEVEGTQRRAKPRNRREK